METREPGGRVTLDNPQGLEFLVVPGGLAAQGEALGPQAWGRLPAGTPLEAQAGPEGTQVWMKRGPLLHPDVFSFDPTA